jgi:hypothetical protein
MIAWGWGVVMFAIIDMLFIGGSGEEIFGSIVLPVGLAFLSCGNAILYLVNRRGCTCPDCPDHVGTFQRKVSIPESKHNSHHVPSH